MLKLHTVFITNTNLNPDYPSVVAPELQDIPTLAPGTDRFVLAEAHRREVGVMAHDIEADPPGGSPLWVMRHGFVREVDTAESWSVGDILWAADDGAVTNVRPGPTKVRVKVGVVWSMAYGSKQVFIDVRVLPPLGELSGVDLESLTPTEREVLMVQDIGGVLGFQNRPIRRSVDTTTNYAVGPHDYLVRADASSGVVTVTLPPAITNADMVVNVKKVDSTRNKVTIDGDGSELIDDTETFDLVLQGENLQMQCNGTSWAVI